MYFKNLEFYDKDNMIYVLGTQIYKYLYTEGLYKKKFCGCIMLE